MATAYQIGASNWPSQRPIISIPSALRSSLSPFNPPLLSRKVSPMTSGRSVSDVFQFRQSANGESNNLHSAQSELLLQLLQELSITFKKADGRGFEAGFQVEGQRLFSIVLDDSGKETETPNGSVCIPSVENFGNSSCFSGLAGYDSRTLLLQTILLGADEKNTRRTLSILAYLASAEASEEDVWLRDDIRIAWITIRYAANDRPAPWEWAFNRVIGGHPSKVIPILVERRQKHAELALPPRKPVTEVKTLAKKVGA